MKPIEKSARIVANINTDNFVPFLSDDGMEDGEVLQVNGGRTGYGFHIYRMAPGQTSIPHVHLGDEEFYIIEGDLTDHDGYEYVTGDIVCLRSGTEHCSTTKNGCLIAVYLRETDGR